MAAGVALALFFGLFIYAKTGPPSRLEPATPEVQKPDENGVPAQLLTVKVPLVSVVGGETQWSVEDVEIAPGADPVLEAVNGFLQRSKIAPDARLLEIRLRTGGAELEFRNLFERGYGTDNDSTILEGVLRAVRENSELETVIFWQDGEPARTLGNLDVGGPQPVR